MKAALLSNDTTDLNNIQGKSSYLKETLGMTVMLRKNQKLLHIQQVKQRGM